MNNFLYYALTYVNTNVTLSVEKGASAFFLPVNSEFHQDTIGFHESRVQFKNVNRIE